MQEKILNQKENKFKNAEKYALKYFCDLKTHFDLTDAQVIKLLGNCILKLKQQNQQKRWWQIF